MHTMINILLLEEIPFSLELTFKEDPQFSQNRESSSLLFPHFGQTLVLGIGI